MAEEMPWWDRVQPSDPHASPVLPPSTSVLCLEVPPLGTPSELAGSRGSQQTLALVSTLPAACPSLLLGRADREPQRGVCVSLGRVHRGLGAVTSCRDTPEPPVPPRSLRFAASTTQRGAPVSGGRCLRMGFCSESSCPACLWAEGRPPSPRFGRAAPAGVSGCPPGLLSSARWRSTRELPQPPRAEG